MPREILIANRHPRLRLDRRAVARVIHTLDAHFKVARSPSILDSRSAISGLPSSISQLPSPLAPGELSVAFLTDPALAQLHADFLADPTPTDVITFEGDPAAGTAGEVCVSVDAALRQVTSIAPRVSSVALAKEDPSRVLRSLGEGGPVAFSAELTLYLVHGWLHLVGYDDLQPAKKRQMRRAEVTAMKLLVAADALPHFSLRR